MDVGLSGRLMIVLLAKRNYLEEVKGVEVACCMDCYMDEGLGCIYGRVIVSSVLVARRALIFVEVERSRSYQVEDEHVLLQQYHFFVVMGDSGQRGVVGVDWSSSNIQNDPDLCSVAAADSAAHVGTGIGKLSQVAVREGGCCEPWICIMCLMS